MNQHNDNNINNSNHLPLPPHLQLTEQEKEWTRGLIQRMTGSESDTEGITPLSSQYEYAVYALATRGNHDEAIRKARGMQSFRATYHIQDTIEEAMMAIQEFIRLQPQHLLHVDATISQGAVVACDFSKWHPKVAMESDQNWKIHVLFFYYLGRIFSLNIEVMRKGLRLLIESTNMSWGNIDIGVEEQLNDELWKHDPYRYEEIRMYNTNSVANLFYCLIKPFLNDDIKRSFRMGWQVEMLDLIFPNAPHNINALIHSIFDSGPKLKLQDLYIQPTYDGAMEHLMKRFQGLLEERDRNDQMFRL